MKNLVMICIIMFGLSTQAQPPKKDGDRAKNSEMREKMESLTPEERANLKTKKMTLHLDLNAAQQTKINALLLEQETKREKMRNEKKKDKTQEGKDFYENASARLDDQIATKAAMKSILSAEQFEKWEKMHQRKGRKKPDRRKRQSNQRSDNHR